MIVTAKDGKVFDGEDVMLNVELCKKYEQELDEKERLTKEKEMKEKQNQEAKKIITETINKDIKKVNDTIQSYKEQFGEMPDVDWFAITNINTKNDTSENDKNKNKINDKDESYKKEKNINSDSFKIDREFAKEFVNGVVDLFGCKLSDKELDDILLEAENEGLLK